MKNHNTLPVAILVMTLLAAPCLTAPGTGAAQEGSRTFPETGKTVSGLFLDYWTGHGGLPQQGLPISDEMQEKGDIDGKQYTVQYFERAVFEKHPENQPPYDVLLTLLGTLAYREKHGTGGTIAPAAVGSQGPCSPTHDDSDSGAGAGFSPEAPERQVVGRGHTVTGMVLSSEGCTPIAGAKLEMRPEVGGGHPEAQRATLYTDSRGHYSFTSEQPEHIHMRVSARGYKGIITNRYHPAANEAQGSYTIVLVPDPTCRQFRETGQTVCGTFLDYWDKHGGLAQQGLPISAEIQEKSELDGKQYTVQYFERAVFEKHPENQPPYDVLLSQLGTLRYKLKHPQAGRIVSTVSLPGEPVKIALGGGFVWVATQDGNGGGKLVRIDPATGRIVGNPEPIGFEPHDVSFGEGGVWVSQQETVARFDPATGKRGALIPIKVGTNYVPVLAAEGSIWVADPAEEVSTVMRIDPATNKPAEQPIKVGQEPLFLVAGGGSIWVGSHDSNTVSRIDPRSYRVVATINTGFNVHGLAYADGALWIADYHGHAVVKVDPGLNRVTGKPIPVGYSFEAISAAEGSVWTAPERFANDAEKGNDRVTRINATTGEVSGILHAGGTLAAVKAGDGQVWIATTEPNALLRVAP